MSSYVLDIVLFCIIDIVWMYRLIDSRPRTARTSPCSPSCEINVFVCEHFRYCSMYLCVCSWRSCASRDCVLVRECQILTAVFWREYCYQFCRFLWRACTCVGSCECVLVRGNSILQSGHKNSSRNLVFLFKKTHTFVGTDLFAFFHSIRVRFTEPVVWLVAVGEIAGRTHPC